MDIREFDPRTLKRGSKETHVLTITTQPDGQMLALQAMCIAGVADGPLVVVLAGVHGDEYEGILAIPRVYAQVDAAALRGTLVMVPVCNMPAFNSATRSSPIDGMNMARVFPGDPKGTLTQRTAYWLGRRLMIHAKLIIDLHSAGVAYNIATLIGYHMGEGEDDRLSRAVAMQFGVDVVWGHPDMPAGRTMSFAHDHHIAGVYTEAPGGGRARPEDVEAYATGVLNSLKVLGMLAGAPEAKPPTHVLMGNGDLDHIVEAGHGGLFVPVVDLLEDVRKGQKLGEVRDVIGNTLEVIYAPADGAIVTMRGLLRVHAGDGLFALAVRQA